MTWSLATAMASFQAARVPVRVVRAQRRDLVGVPGLDPPGGVLASDERLPVGLPAELPGDRVPRHRVLVCRLRGGEPAFSLPRLGLDDRQPCVAHLGDQLPAALGDGPADKPTDPAAAVPPRQFDQVVSVRVDVHPDREQPRPGDAGVTRPVVLQEVDAVRRDDVRLGDDVAIGQGGVVQACHEIQSAVVGNLADAVRSKGVVCCVFRRSRVGFGPLGEDAQLVDHRVDIRVGRFGLAGALLPP
jgi:hypothetical protein